ncbi:Cyclin CCL1 [Astathelohania contejeani]|uniref:Cyclin CCL1 n=1 Tax=Astathelohania contejeani TaxID=164912 RepID=A0ABQ7I1C9_9MICR|nr:Cyclin CCL1 [Thelohania contejeani]
MNIFSDSDNANDLLIYAKIQIINICKGLMLPFTVQSTATVFFNKIFNTSKIENLDLNNLIYSIILLAIKSENIHEDLHTLVNKLEHADECLIEKYEEIVAERLKFDFYVRCPHLRCFGFIVMLQEKERVIVKNGMVDINKVVANKEVLNIKPTASKINGIENDVYKIEDLNELWEKCVLNLEILLCLPNYLNYNVNEIALASIDIPEKFLFGLIEKIDWDNVEKLKALIENTNKVDLAEVERKTGIILKPPFNV